MSTKTAPPAARSRGGQLLAGAPRVPQVNLLPPEIRASRSLRQLKRLLALVLVLVVVAAGAGYAWSALQVQEAQSALEEAQAETARLLSQQAEYAEVPQVLGTLEDITTARELGTSTEVLWSTPLTSLVLTAPTGIQFESLVLSGATPTVAAGLPENPLATATPLRIDFVGRAPLLPDTAAWIEQIEAIPGFVDAYVTAAAIQEETGDEGEAGTVYYEITGSVQLTDELLAQRYAAEAEQTTDEGDE